MDFHIILTYRCEANQVRLIPCSRNTTSSDTKHHKREQQLPALVYAGTRRHISIFSKLLLPCNWLKWQSFNTLRTQLYPNVLICLPHATNHTHPNPSSNLLKVDLPKACFTSESFYFPEAFCLLNLPPHPQAGVQNLKI